MEMIKWFFLDGVHAGSHSPVVYLGVKGTTDIDPNLAEPLLAVGYYAVLGAEQAIYLSVLTAFVIKSLLHLSPFLYT
jgi:Na+-transporting methylmalonyl-CoA/oxaloacetate decarboxylase beta subunit